MKCATAGLLAALAGAARIPALDVLSHTPLAPLAHELARHVLPSDFLHTRAPNQWCKNNTYWEFVPAQLGALMTGVPATFPGLCFASLAMSTTSNATHVLISVTGSNVTSPLCSESLFFASAYSPAILAIGDLNPTGSTAIAFTSSHEASDVAMNGVRAFLLPCGTLGTLASLAATVSLFISSDEAALQVANVEFMTQRGLWPGPTPFNTTVELDPTTLRSGTYLAITRLDGLDPTIALGTMGATGHSALAVWEGDVLYVTESTDANPFGRVYWPPPYGIIRHNWTTWVPLAQAAGYHVAVLQPTAEVAAAFNETAFWAWFATVQGMPYGYHSMLFSFLDTSPLANLPLPMTPDLISVVINILDGLLPNSSAGVSAFSMFTWGLNKRLQANCSTFACILDIIVTNQAAGTGITRLDEALAIPDSDSWKFGTNFSMVCSEYAAHGWKNGLAGAFPVWNDISAGEQTPKDNYQMQLFDGAFFDTTNCPGGGLRDTQGGTYCQIMGPYVLSLAGFNSVPLYPHINEQCLSQWPSPARCPANNASCLC